MRRWVGVIALSVLLGAGLTALLGCREARSDPIVRRMAVKLPRWPAAEAPVQVLVWSDLHLGNTATPPARIARLVAQANALKPDLIVLAGDYVAGPRREDAAAAVRDLAPLRRLRARFGVVAVMGNHEYWTDAPPVRAALARAGVVVLANTAVELGPLAVGGIDDMVNRREQVAVTADAVRRLPGARVLLSHSPDIAPRLPADMPLLLAGHSHCGQIVVPGYGPLVEVTQPRYRCGAVREGRRLTIVTAGTGTSVVPLRWGARPDWWLLTLGP